MASINEMVAAEVNACIEKAARRIYNKNVKLSAEEVTNLIERYLYTLINEKTNEKTTLAHILIKKAVLEVDNVKT